MVLVFSMSRKRGRPGKKAVVRAECLARLKGGALPAELLREFSPGPVYDAVREYLSFVAGEIEEVRRSGESESLDLARVREEGKAVVGEVAARKAEAQKLTLRVSELEEGIKAKEKSVTELGQRVDQLEGKLSEYSKRGVFDSTFRRLDRFSFGSEDELIVRLDTVERYLVFRSEAESLEAELPGLRKSASDLGDTKRSLESEIIRLKGERDKELSRNYVQSESIRILGSFYKAGYTSEDIEGIKIGLDTLGVDKDPRISVKVLIDLLGKEIRLGRLETNIAARTAELDEIENDIDLAKTSLFGIRDAALATVKELETSSKNGVKRVGDDAISKLAAAGEVGMKQLDDFSKNSVKAVDEAAKAGLGNLIDIHNLAKEEIGETAGAVVNEVRETIRSEFEPYHKVFGLIPMMQPFLEYGFILMRVPHNRLLANKVPAIFVANMATSIDLWIKEMMPEAFTYAPEELAPIMTTLERKIPCKLQVVSKWLSQELAIKIRSI